MSDQPEEERYQGDELMRLPTSSEVSSQNQSREEKIARWNEKFSGTFEPSLEVLAEGHIVTETEVVCLQCGEQMGSMNTDAQGTITLTHPALETDESSEPYKLEVSPLLAHCSPQDMAMTIGSWIRTIHRDKGLTIINPLSWDNAVVNAHHVGVVVPPPEKLRKTEPTNHMRNLLHPLLAPHLEAIANILHITEGLGPMSSWTLDMEPDQLCGFVAQFEIRVLSTGSCFIKPEETPVVKPPQEVTIETSTSRNIEREVAALRAEYEEVRAKQRAAGSRTDDDANSPGHADDGHDSDSSPDTESGGDER